MSQIVQEFGMPCRAGFSHAFASLHFPDSRSSESPQTWGLPTFYRRIGRNHAGCPRFAKHESLEQESANYQAFNQIARAFSNGIDRIANLNTLGHIGYSQN